MSQLMPLPLTGSCFSKIQTGFTFLVPEKGPLNGCVCVCVCVCACVRVCMCLSVHDHIFGFTRPIFTTFFVRVTYGRGSVLLWQRNDMLCTSGFTDNERHIRS